MKALIPSGGRGTRLQPLTHTSPKQLIPVANKPVIFHALENIADLGIKEAGIVVGSTCGQVRHAVGDGSRFGLQVSYIEQPSPDGLADTVLMARDYLGDDDFIMFLGDIFVGEGLKKVMSDFEAHKPDAQLLVAPVADPSSFGVVAVDDRARVLHIEEKPQRPFSDLASVGVYLFSSAIHTAVQRIAPSPRGELEISDAVQWLVAHEHAVRATVTTGYWNDTGSASGLLGVNRFALDYLTGPRIDGSVDRSSEVVGNVVIDSGASIENSRITGPVVIGEGARIRNSVIGPHVSVSEGCTISDSLIEASIILADASVNSRGRKITDSVIGRHAAVTVPDLPSQAVRLLLGDHTSVELPH